MKSFALPLTFLLLGCGSSSVEDPCGAPPELDVPVRRSSLAAPLHWPSGECIAVSYDPALEARRGVIEAALSEWMPECSDLCLQLTGPSSEAPDEASRRVHLVATEAQAHRVTFLHDANTGVIGAVEITFAQAAVDGDLSRLLGQAMGVDAKNEGAPTAEELDTLCVLYGASPLCSD